MGSNSMEDGVDAPLLSIRTITAFLPSSNLVDADCTSLISEAAQFLKAAKAKFESSGAPMPVINGFAATLPGAAWSILVG